jgi:hypothetical protein
MERGNGMQWVEFSPQLMNHAYGFSGNEANEDHRLNPDIALSSQYVNHIEKEEALCLAGNGMTDDNLDENVAHRAPGWIMRENDLDFADFKREDDDEEQVLVTTTQDGTLSDFLVTTNPRDAAFDATVRHFGMIGSKLAGEDLNNSELSSIPTLSKNPFAMRKPAPVQPMMPPAQGPNGGGGGGIQTAMESMTKGQGDNMDYYFEAVANPFTPQQESIMDYRDKLGLRKNIQENQGNQLRYVEGQDRFDAALDSHVHKDIDAKTSFRDTDSLLVRRGYITQKVREVQLEQLRVPGGQMLAENLGVGDLSRINYKKYKAQKHKGHGLEGEMM